MSEQTSVTAASEAQALIDSAMLHLRKTTVGYAGHPQSWYANQKTEWWQAMNYLAEARAALDAPAPAPATKNPVPPPATGVYLGAYVGSWDWSTWEAKAGKKVKLAMFGMPNMFSNGDMGNLVGGLDAVGQMTGAVPVVDCMTDQTGTLADFAAGKYDAGIDKAAAACKAFGKPAVVRVDAEMNGGWYGFGKEIRASAAGPANFIACWQRIVTRFRAAGATNVAFHWCPNTDIGHSEFPLEQLFPGDAFVDWSGITGYNHGNETMAWGFDDTYSRVAALTQTPLMIGETGSVDLLGPVPGSSNPTKVQWIGQLAAWMAARPQVKGFCWFDVVANEGGYLWDWVIDSTPAALAAFQRFAVDATVVGRGV